MGGARIVMFHGVSGGGECHPQTVFEDQLRWLARHFRVVPLSKIVETVQSGERTRGDEVALTFDDGLRNNAKIVAPMLALHGAPATFFVCPGLIKSGRWLWNHEVRARLGTLAPEAQRTLIKQVRADGPPPARRAGSMESFVRWMKTMDPDARADAEERIRGATPDFAPSPRLKRAFDIMSQAELRSLDPEWISIGSHTLTHPILPTLSDRQLAREVRQSREDLEALVGRKVPFFCYPDGAVNERVGRAVAAHYRAAVTTEAAVISPGSDPLRLPRIGAGSRLAELAWRMFRP